jgi:hypothetical protein
MDDYEVMHFALYSNYTDTLVYRLMRLLCKLKESQLPPSVIVVEKKVELTPCEVIKTVPITIKFPCKSYFCDCDIWN